MGVRGVCLYGQLELVSLHPQLRLRLRRLPHPSRITHTHTHTHTHTQPARSESLDPSHVLAGPQRPWLGPRAHLVQPT